MAGGRRPTPTLGDVLRARKAIADVASRTPLMESDELSRQLGREVQLKLEVLQATHSFKVRGAANRILALSGEERRRGVVTASTGNHGRAVAHVARRLGIAAVVFVSRLVGENKLVEIRKLGAEVRIAGVGQDEASVAAKKLAAERSMTLVNPFDDPEVIAGQGTVALEILDDRSPATIVVPVGGGGLISGIALVAKSIDPRIRIIGVSMQRGPAMYESLRAGAPTEVEELPTLADSLGGGIFLDNRYTFELTRRFVDDLVLVSEREIADAMILLVRAHHLAVEGAGAVGVAALLAGRVSGDGEVAVVLSGANVDAAKLAQLVLDRGSKADAAAPPGTL